MAQNRLVINGYPVPSGYGGVAVRRACELILQAPGLAQADVLRLVLGASGLNPSTSGWITSPSPKSPATRLWDRRKEKVFRCYPNEFTALAGSSRAHLVETVIKDVRSMIKGLPTCLKQGDLVEVHDKIENTQHVGMFMGLSIQFGTGYVSREPIDVTSPDELLWHQDIIAPSPRVRIKIFNDCGERSFSTYLAVLKPI